MGSTKGTKDTKEHRGIATKRHEKAQKGRGALAYQGPKRGGIMEPMILEYLDAATTTARCEMIEDREPFYGEIPDLQGVWASGETLEGCRKNLATAVEDWILFSIARGNLVLIF